MRTPIHFLINQLPAQRQLKTPNGLTRNLSREYFPLVEFELRWKAVVRVQRVMSTASWCDTTSVYREVILSEYL